MDEEIVEHRDVIAAVGDARDREHAFVQRDRGGGLAEQLQHRDLRAQRGDRAEVAGAEALVDERDPVVDPAQRLGTVAALRERLGETPVGAVADRGAAHLVELRRLRERVAARGLASVVEAAERAVTPCRRVIEVGEAVRIAGADRRRACDRQQRLQPRQIRAVRGIDDADRVRARGEPIGVHGRGDLGGLRTRWRRAAGSPVTSCRSAFATSASASRGW